MRNIGATAAAVTEQEAAAAEVAGEVGNRIFGVADAARETSRTWSEAHEAAASPSGLVGQLKQEVANVVVGLRG